MSLAWFLFTNIATLGVLAYNTTFKLAAPLINPFMFTLILGVTQVTVLLLVFVVARYGFQVDFLSDVKPRGVMMAVLAGIAVVVIDISYFFAFRHGSAMLTNTYCSVAGIVLFTALCMAAFGEALTWTKCAGIAMGVASLVLIAL